MIKEITILTATFNRECELELLYNSLLRQTNSKFKWLIIDDGSTDNTSGRVKQWILDGLIDIEYYYKDNGGKHTAINYAMKYVTTRLTFIVDSDDYLTDDAIEIIYNYDIKYHDDLEICGYSFLRMFPNGNVNNRLFPKNEMKGTYIEIRINGNIGGDKAEVFFSDILKKFPFPEYPGEKFIGEDTVWIDMAQSYQMIHINEKIYVGEYLDSGLTVQARALKRESPKGAVKRAEMFMNRKCNFYARMKGAFMYSIYGRFANMSFGELYKKTEYKILFLLSYPIGSLVYYVWSKRK